MQRRVRRSICPMPDPKALARGSYAPRGRAARCLRARGRGVCARFARAGMEAVRFHGSVAQCVAAR